MIKTLINRDTFSENYKKRSIKILQNYLNKVNKMLTFIFTYRKIAFIKLSILPEIDIFN